MNYATKNQVANVIVAGIVALAVPLIIAYGCLAEGFALMHMWDWFLSEPFGFPRLGMLHAAGISLLVGLVSHQFNHIGDGAHRQMWFHVAFNPWIRLTIAWIVYKAMVSL